jgi:hypothetical protein
VSTAGAAAAADTTPPTIIAAVTRAIGGFDAAAFNIGSGSLCQSIRNNLFTNFLDVNGTFRASFVSSDGSITGPRALDPVSFGYPRQRGRAARRAGESQALRTTRNSLWCVRGCVWLTRAPPGRSCRTIETCISRRRAARSSTTESAADGAGAFIGAVGHRGAHSMDLFGRIVP